MAEPSSSAAVATVWSAVSAASVLVLGVNLQLLILAVLGSLPGLVKAEPPAPTTQGRSLVLLSWVGTIVLAALIAAGTREVFTLGPRVEGAIAALVAYGGNDLLRKSVEWFNKAVMGVIEKWTR